MVSRKPDATAESYTKPLMGKAGREVLCAINPPTKPSTPRLVRGFFIGLLQATVPFIQGSSSEEDQALMPGARVSISVAAAINMKRISGPGRDTNATTLLRSFSLGMEMETS